ncbi:alpha/beta hydrolase [Nesterenkonia flava]|uniref:Alpha/beta fold hydrolase n=1 Tax=Nesterenkonia flava TaxID=469799 RepID=A0ABU1FPM0_9MICC|nr:alpha/beta fold hydrolase [Nesterenkonia flava]MDR5710594.1 alpha/beta fold hydrolase [Nesterenkonia flava]
MSTFVLTSGAWHGGWCWQRVAPLLRDAGHEVHTPTLTGLSDAAHLISPSVGLETHVTDVVSLIEAYDLRDVILVGHSYAGQVITGVADRVSERISRRVHLDGFIGDGQPAIDLLPEKVAHHYYESVAEAGFGWLIPPRPLEKLGVTDQRDIDWLVPRLTPHPWKTYTDPLPLSGAYQEVTGVYVECVDWMRVFQPFHEQAAAAGWDTYEVATGHEAMVTAPAELAEVLRTIADRAAVSAPKHD